MIIIVFHQIPRTKGFVAAMSSLDKTKVTAIYDVTLAMPADDVATMSTLLVGKKAVGHMYVRRFDINSLPSGINFSLLGTSCWLIVVRW